jgi:hypothetical protein
MSRSEVWSGDWSDPVSLQDTPDHSDQYIQVRNGLFGPLRTIRTLQDKGRGS